MKNSLLIATALTVTFSSCTSEEKKPDTKPVVNVATAPLPKAPLPTTVYDEAALKDIKPLQFLDSLRLHKPESFVTVKSFPNKWITAADIKDLMPLIESREACAGVVSSASNNIPPSNIHSTIGVEAMMLIEGFRNKKYPAYNTSVEFGKGMQMGKDKKLSILPGQDLVDGEKAWFKKQK